MAKKISIEPISKPCINISVIACWKCKSDMIIPYYSNGIVNPVGPSSFTDHQIEIARQEGCLLQNSFNKTNETSYLTTICPACGSPMGDFYYPNFANIPGDVQYFLDEKDGVLERIENKKIELRTPNKFDETKHQKDLESEKVSTIINSTNYINKGICVLVLFEDERMYKYNCRFDVKLGDIVKVDGKMSEKLGEVVEFEGEWDQQEYMKEIVEILSSKYEGFSITENIAQRKIDIQRIQKDEYTADSSVNTCSWGIDLCNEKLENIEIHASASVSGNRFEAHALSYVKCENYLGGEFTTDESYIFDRLNTEKFYNSLEQSADLPRLSEIIKQRFGGIRGLRILEEYCKEKDILYSYTDIFRE